ncbi:MAG: LD-carboxypeptidase [Bacteroidales bacterium]|nr:LD-carboxypeptidase [Bacteroidales bacterium]
MIDRKKFIKQIGLLSGFTLLSSTNLFAFNSSQTSSINLRKRIPKKLKKGATFGLITPSGVITKKQLEETVKEIESLGYKAYYKASILSEFGYLAGTDEERSDELIHMFENPDVDAILCVRGGYGAIRILDLIDYNIIKKNPKIFIGYSDITALITAFYLKSGLVSYHGPVGISTFNEFSLKSLFNIISKTKSTHLYSYEREPETDNNSEFDFFTINNGKASGELIGGNMSVLVSMIGGKFEPEFKGKIVYLEEIDEKTYKIDKMLTQLIYSTDLKEASGIIFGIFSGCDNNEEPTFLLKELLIQIITPLKIPVVYGFPFGHVKNKITLPTGIKAELNADTKTLKLIEKTVN